MSIPDKNSEEEEEEDDIIEESETEEVIIIPHTDLPKVLLVKEDEYTEKIQRDQTETKFDDIESPKLTENESRIEEGTSIAKETTSESQYLQNDVEVLTVTDTKSNAARPDPPVAPKQAFEKSSHSQDQEQPNTEKPKARVAFADPTLDIDAHVQLPSPSPSKANIVQTISEEEMTLSSLAPEELQHTAEPSEPTQGSPEKSKEMQLGLVYYSNVIATILTLSPRE